MLRLLLAAPFLLVLVAFALSNRQPVTLGLWPTDYTLNPPASAAILVAMAAAFLLGALLVWGGTLAQRRRARRAEHRVRVLESEIEILRARLSPPALAAPDLPPPATQPAPLDATAPLPAMEP